MSIFNRYLINNASHNSFYWLCIVSFLIFLVFFMIDISLYTSFAVIHVKSKANGGERLELVIVP